MGLVFNPEMGRLYEAWYQAPQGLGANHGLGPLLLHLLRPTHRDRVLDVGCGSGNHLLLLHRCGLDITGVDASPYMLTRARERLGPSAALEAGRAEDLPFDDNAFDFVIMIHTLEFLDDPLAALREAGRVARKRVLVGVQNSLSWNGLLKRIQGYLGHRLFNAAHFYDLWKVRGMLEKAYGPVPVSWGCLGPRTPLGRGRDHAQEPTATPGILHSPFAGFLGVAAAMVPRLATRPLPLALRLQGAGRRPLLRPGAAGNLQRFGGRYGIERGLSL